MWASGARILRGIDEIFARFGLSSWKNRVYKSRKTRSRHVMDSSRDQGAVPCWYKSK